ncbi:MAG: sulfatase [Aestuariibaculum sp.]
MKLLNSSIWLSVACLILACKSQNKQLPNPAETKPNIVFIAVDDLRADLGCYGNTVVKSPNLDKLAATGILFENHFTNVPTCGASRHSLLTGMRPKAKAFLGNDITKHTLSKQPETDMPETFIHHLKRNGYYTVGIGKISHSADGYLYGYTEKPSSVRELPHSWNELLFDYGKWKTGWNAFFGYANGENRQSLNQQVKPYENAKVSDTGYVDGLTAQLAISKLKKLKKSSKPFFMGVGFFKPHLPFNSPEIYWDLYERDAMPLSPNPEIPVNINLKSLHNSNEFNQYKLTDEVPSLKQSVSPEYAKKLRHAYYACVSYIDQQIGLLIKEIENLNLNNNTIIVVWGDHGWHLGDQQMWGKHSLFENALKSTLIVKVPRKYQSQSVKTIVETVDIYPTLLELCNIKQPHILDGESFVNILEGQVEQNKAVAYGYFNKGISLRTERYRLTKYFRKGTPTIELYDYKTDPHETKNIASNNQELVNRLLPLLEKGNTGLYDF